MGISLDESIAAVKESLDGFRSFVEMVLDLIEAIDAEVPDVGMRLDDGRKVSLSAWNGCVGKDGIGFDSGRVVIRARSPHVRTARSAVIAWCADHGIEHGLTGSDS